MVQIKDLNFRKFANNTSSKAGCQISTAISMDAYLASKECSDNNKIVPYSGHQIIDGISNRLNQHLPDNARNWGNVYVYRDQLRFDGYVERMTPETTRSKLLTPDVPISELVFERAIATIDIFPPTTVTGIGEISYRMAVKYGPRELEVAIGPNVQICNNFNIFGGKRYVASRDFPYELMIIHLEETIRNAENAYGTDLQTIRLLADRPISKKTTMQLLGQMQLEYYGKNPILPITDVNAVASNIAKAEINTYWDVLNAATQPLKYDTSSGEATLDSIQKVCDFIVAKAESDYDLVTAAPVQPAEAIALT
jgi:hypothetical protein